MIEKVLAVAAGLCSGCRICELWCSLNHYGLINPSQSRIQISRDHHTLANTAQVCLQCSDRYCITACPSKIQALSLETHTGAVLVDGEKCITCGECMEACPYDGIHLPAAEEQVVVCDLCSGDPECVKRCPEGVLSYAARGEG